MACKNCIDEVSSDCIKWTGDSSLGCEFTEIIESLIKNNSKEHQIDVKTLSKELDLSKDQIIQLLIDEIIKLKLPSTSESKDKLSCSKVIGTTSTDNLCTIIDYMFSEINGIKSQLVTLTNNEY